MPLEFNISEKKRVVVVKTEFCTIDIIESSLIKYVRNSKEVVMYVTTKFKNKTLVEYVAR